MKVASFCQRSFGRCTLTDSRGTRVHMLADVASSFADLHRRKQAGENIVVAIASRSDEPTWARECLRKFIVAPGVSMWTSSATAAARSTRARRSIT